MPFTTSPLGRTEYLAYSLLLTLVCATWVWGVRVIWVLGLSILCTHIVALIWSKLTSRQIFRSLSKDLLLCSILTLTTLTTFAEYSWLILAIATACSSLLAKSITLYFALNSQATGPITNPINPAMTGFVCVWLALLVPLAAQSISGVDGISSASALQVLAEGTNGLTWAELNKTATFGNLGDTQDQIINLVVWLTGVLLIFLRLLDWRIIVGFVCGITLASGIGFDGSSNTYGTPITHLFSGGAALMGCYLLTDPRSFSPQFRHQMATNSPFSWVIASFPPFVAGVMLFFGRKFSPYADPVALVVLTYNFALPALTHLAIYFAHRLRSWAQPS